MASDKIIHATAKTFQSIMEGDLPCLVNFSAAWCGPCRQISPVLDALAEEFDGIVNIVKVNVDDNQEIASDFNVRAIPTLILFKSGEKVDQVTGAIPKGKLVDFIKKAL